MQDHLWFMGLALEEAELAYRKQEVPVGAVLVSSNGDVLARTHNLKELNLDPCAHAEVLAIQQASHKMKDWRLNNCTLYVTLEPCPMCLGALVHARIGQLVFGAYDPKGGAMSLGYNMHRDQRLNHRFSVIGGIKHYECSRVLSQFFREKRKSYQHTHRDPP